MSDVQSPIIPVVGDLIRNNPGTISLGQGVVHYGPPPQAIERIARFHESADNHKYKLVDGIPALQDAIRAKLAADNGVRLRDDQRIVVTAGGNMAFMNAVYAIADPGDEIIIQRPYYFNHEMAIMMANCTPVPVATGDDYQLDVEAIAAAITPRTRAVVTISPNNPTGAVYTEASLRAINDLCKDRGIYHIHDEAYEYFIYGNALHFSPASIDGASGHTLSLYSLSKAYGFASWRIGYMLIPEYLFFSIKKAQDTVLICPPVICQEAAVGAMTVGSPYCRRFVKDMSQVREDVLAALTKLGKRVTVPATQGAFYFLVRVHTSMDAMTLVERLVREFKIAVIPGTTFGVTEHCSLRISYGSLRRETVADGIGRLVRGLESIVQ